MVLLLLVVLALGLALLAYQNPGRVDLTFGIWSWHVPLWYPVAAAAGAMLLIALFWSLLTRRRIHADERALGSARHEAVIANHAALLADHEAAIASLQRETDRLDRETERLDGEVHRRHNLLA